MSGGYFNYQQYVLHDIATEIETIISKNDSTEQNEFGDDIGYHFPDHIISEFKTAVDLLKRAEIYVQRIDWLLSGDDGEETFIERLKSGFPQTDPYVDWGNKDGLHDECEGCTKKSCDGCKGPRINVETLKWNGIT